ncbi:hypothetical protein IEQ34_013854 [Dendrobium chrysotoxum]|uniref:Uncharacterized protein n=1 Tax=Dendrobium chrysotoxum TaxID=161865 RepID=A0AAV7GSN2_DENCH|nr:hypothetical protein IEQ34_013854 [Dendrobium chrysotoxum]
MTQNLPWIQNLNWALDHRSSNLANAVQNLDLPRLGLGEMGNTSPSNVWARGSPEPRVRVGRGWISKEIARTTGQRGLGRWGMRGECSESSRRLFESLDENQDVWVRESYSNDPHSHGWLGSIEQAIRWLPSGRGHPRKSFQAQGDITQSLGKLSYDMQEKYNQRHKILSIIQRRGSGQIIYAALLRTPSECYKRDMGALTSLSGSTVAIKYQLCSAEFSCCAFGNSGTRGSSKSSTGVLDFNIVVLSYLLYSNFGLSMQHYGTRENHLRWFSQLKRRPSNDHVWRIDNDFLLNLNENLSLYWTQWRKKILVGDLTLYHYRKISYFSYNGTTQQWRNHDEYTRLRESQVAAGEASTRGSTNIFDYRIWSQAIAEFQLQSTIGRIFMGFAEAMSILSSLFEKLCGAKKVSTGVPSAKS